MERLPQAKACHLRSDQSWVAREAVRTSIAIARDGDRDCFTLSDFKRKKWSGIGSKPKGRAELLEKLFATGHLVKTQHRPRTVAEAYYFPRLDTRPRRRHAQRDARRETVRRMV